MGAPGDYRAQETLPGDLVATIRALRPDDRDRVAAAVRGLDRESVYRRLFGYRGALTEAGLDRIMRFDPPREVALVATVDDQGSERVIGSCRYVVGQPGTAEVAFVVEEDFQGRGVASRLLRHLATVALEQGVGTFEASVLADNKPMRTVLERTGWPLHTRQEGETVHVTLTLPAGSP